MNMWTLVFYGSTAAGFFVTGYCASTLRRRLKLRPRKPISLPGMSQEEAAVEDFIEVLHDDTRDDIRLVNLHSTPPWRRKTLAISSIAFETNMNRIRSFMEQRSLGITARIQVPASTDETIVDREVPTRLKR